MTMRMLLDWMFFPDSNQLLGQDWAIVGLVGGTSLLARRHCPNIGLKYQQLKYWPYNYAPTVDFE